MNFVTHALDFFNSRLLPAFCKSAPTDFVVASAIAQELKNSIKFLLPANAETGVHVSQAVMNLLRVPYPCLAFEYSMTPSSATGRWESLDNLNIPVEASPKRIALVWRVSPTEEMTVFAKAFISKHSDKLAGKTGALVASIFYIGDRTEPMWCLAGGISFVESGSEVKILYTDRHPKGVSSYFSDIFLLLPDTCKGIFAQMPNGVNGMDFLMNDLADETTCAITAIAAINAKNVHKLTVEAPAKLNTKRAKNGKTPFFEYKVLDIHLNGGKLSKHRERVLSALEAIRKGARLHSVIGHFKTRKSGIFWWSDYTRGSKQNGSLKKDYTLSV